MSEPNKPLDADVDNVLERWERTFGPRQDEASPAMQETLRRVDSLQDNAGLPPTPAPSRGIRFRLSAGQPRAVFAILAINVVMYGLTYFLSWQRGNTDMSYTYVLYLLGAKYGPAIDAGQYWRFITPVFLHGGLIHLAFNSYALYIMGPQAERLFGTWRFLAIYLLAGFAGVLGSYIHSPGLSIGASGAIFGLIGALAAFFYVVRSLIGAEASRQQLNQLIGLAVVNLLFGFIMPTIDNAAHIGGLLAGTVAGYILAPRYRVDQRLYPPQVVRADRTVIGWLGVGVFMVVLLAAAAVAVVMLRGTRG